MTDRPQVTIAEIDAAIARLAEERDTPQTTYRLQFSGAFTFRDAEALVPYLRRLGITDLYASPLQKASPGSTHGYDVCDPTQLNPELGTRADFDSLTATLADHDMRLLLDIVPNHMGITSNCNGWWLDVLENGPASAYAHFFDIDWSPVKPELANKVLLPVLEDQYGNVLDSGKLTLVYTDGRFELHYHDFHLPIAPGAFGDVLQPMVEPLIAELGADHDDVLELQSILTSVMHLPGREALAPDARTERHREKEVIKRRLDALVRASAPVQAALDTAVTAINGLPGDQSSFDRLDALIRAQAYRLAYWRVAGEEINYRRFFDVNSMAAINNELPDVFQATHELVLSLAASGQVGGLRVDHPDGLWNPPGYFRDVQAAYLSRRACAELGVEAETTRAVVEARVAGWLDEHAGDRIGRPLYVVAEKILSESEPLPPEWAVSGTTGYDFMNQINGLFVDQTNERAFDALYADFIGQRIDFYRLEYDSKRMIMRESLAGEINSLAHQLERLAESNRHYRDFTLDGLRSAISEVVACMSIYRTYVTGPDAVSLRDQSFVEAAVQDARKRNPRVSQSLFYFLRDCILLRNYYEFPEQQREHLLHWVMRFQQVTGPVMAKSVEDTAFYIYNRMVSLNEVGGQPATFGISLDEFHALNAERQRDWPHAMTSTSTHDTKRSEDVRARLNVLTEMPDAWAEALAQWRDLNARHVAALLEGSGPDANDEYLLYQTLVGALTDGDLTSAGVSEMFVERIQAYMAKATREAKVRTSWTHGDPGYDEAVATFIARILDAQASPEFFASWLAFTQRVAFFGRLNSLSQTLLKILSPGVPDTYRGTEAWDFSLVDPDNRRPVDYGALVARLDALDAAADADLGGLVARLTDDLADDDAKLYVTRCALAFRTTHAALFEQGTYQPLAASGARERHVCAFAWAAPDSLAVVVAPRLVAGLTNGDQVLPLGQAVWDDTRLSLPMLRAGQRLRDMLTGAVVTVEAGDEDAGVLLADVLTAFPLALLVVES